MPKKADLILLDASVVVAAALSSNGGSAVVFELTNKGLTELVLTEEIVIEARLSIKAKYGAEKLADLYKLLASHKLATKPTPSQQEQKQFLTLINDSRDCHVLAGATKYQVKYLVTLDKKHFFTPKLTGAKLPFQILTPGQFLQLWQDHNS